MPRAHAKPRLGMLLAAVVLVGCAARASSEFTPEPPVAPLSCAAGFDTVQVAVTGEVDSLTVIGFLATAPLGQCAATTTRRVPLGEARDVLDAGVAMLITSVPAAIAYADTRADFHSLPLAWDRSYALVLADSASALLPASGAALDSLRAGLTRDVVRGDARPSSSMPCGVAAAPTARPRPRIGYASNDSVARSIAARLVALAPPEDSLRAAALDDGVPDSRDVAAVMSFPVGDLAPCTRGGYVVPLVETRARAIVPVSRP